MLMIPYYQTDRGILYYGDALFMDKRIPPESVHCVVTSPPYWGLRNYFGSGEDQLGLEKTPEQYVDHLVAIFKKLKTVLHPTGTVWLNIDDTYCVPSTKREGELQMKPGVPAKNMIGIPWKVAFALQQDGWHLRCDVIWNAPNKLPEPMRDRPTRSHEYVFLLTKKQWYFYDQVAVYEKIQHTNRFAGDRTKIIAETHDMFHGGHMIKRKLAGKNRRSVWTIPTEATSDPHHAGFPTRLAALGIKAGTSLKGCCSQCYSPINRIVQPKDDPDSYENMMTTVGWEPSCNCHADVIPCTVLDPFTGRGTTLMTAERLNRRWIGIEIAIESVQLAKQNLLNQQSGMKSVNEVTDGLFRKDELDVSVE